MNPVPLLLIIVTLPLLLGGCGESNPPKKGFKYSESELNYQHYVEGLGPPRYVSGKAYTGRLYELGTNGQLIEEGYYKEGFLDGERRVWHENGQMKWESSWKKGKEQAGSKVWDENGNLRDPAHRRKAGES